MECGDCTMCCEVFPVKWLEKPANTICKHACNGCAIHDTKPAECINFDCAYVQMENVSINLRPDKCGVIFEKVSDKIFYGTLHPDYEITNVVKGQIDAFARQGFSVVMYSFKEEHPFMMIADGHDKDEITNEFEKHLKNKYGSSNVYN